MAQSLEHTQRSPFVSFMGGCRGLDPGYQGKTKSMSTIIQQRLEGPSLSYHLVAQLVLPSWSDDQTDRRIESSSTGYWRW